MWKLLDTLEGFFCQPLVDGPMPDFTIPPIDQLDGVPQTPIPETKAVDLGQQVLKLFIGFYPFDKNSIIPTFTELFFEFFKHF